MSDKMIHVYEKCSRFGAPVCFDGWPEYFTYLFNDTQTDYSESTTIRLNSFDAEELPQYDIPSDYYDFSQFKLFRALYDI